MDVVPWCYKWMVGWNGYIWAGGRNRAPHGANNRKSLKLYKVSYFKLTATNQSKIESLNYFKPLSSTLNQPLSTSFTHFLVTSLMQISTNSGSLYLELYVNSMAN